MESFGWFMAGFFVCAGLGVLVAGLLWLDEWRAAKLYSAGRLDNVVRLDGRRVGP